MESLKRYEKCVLEYYEGNFNVIFDRELVYAVQGITSCFDIHFVGHLPNLKNIKSCCDKN